MMWWLNSTFFKSDNSQCKLYTILWDATHSGNDRQNRDKRLWSDDSESKSSLWMPNMCCKLKISWWFNDIFKRQVFLMRKCPNQWNDSGGPTPKYLFLVFRKHKSYQVSPWRYVFIHLIYAIYSLMRNEIHTYFEWIWILTQMHLF